MLAYQDNNRNERPYSRNYPDIFLQRNHIGFRVFSPGSLFRIRLPDPTANRRHKIGHFHISETTTESVSVKIIMRIINGEDVQNKLFVDDSRD